MNTSLNSVVVIISTNKSGGPLLYGDVVIPSSAASRGVTTTTDTGIIAPVGVVVDPGGIAADGQGAIAWQGYVPRINLLTAAARTDGLIVSASAGRAAVSASSSSSAFGMALSDGATPDAVLFGRVPSAASMASLTDVILAGLASGDGLVFDGSDWKNLPTDVSAYVYKSGTQAVGPASTVTVTWESERFDTDAMYDAGSNTRITFNTPGKYLVIASVAFDSNSVAAASLLLNGATSIARQSQGNSAVTEGVTVSTYRDFGAGDYLEVRFYAGNNGNIQVSNTHFEAALIART